MQNLFDTETGLPSIGDFVPDDASFVFLDDAEKTVTLTRVGDKIHIRTDWKSVKALLEQNAADAKEFNATGSLGDMTRVASIPTGIFYDWDEQGIIDDQDALDRRLNDADFSKFRTNNIRL